MKKLILLLLICAFNIQFAYSAEVIGRVVKSHGVAQKINKSMKVDQNLKEGDELYQGDIIKTGKSSLVKVLMKDDTLFQIGPQTEFGFEEFKFRTKKDRDATYNLARGKLRSLFTVKSKTKSLRIKTPSAAMGIRGTEILSDVYSHNGQLKTDIALVSGKLEIDARGTGNKIETFLIKPGFVLEMGKALQGSKILAKPKMREIPKKIFTKLKKADKKGGEVFLFDARQNTGEKFKGKVEFGGLNVKAEKEMTMRPDAPQDTNVKAVRSGNKLNIPRAIAVKKGMKLKRKGAQHKGKDAKKAAMNAAQHAAKLAAQQAAQQAAMAAHQAAQQAAEDAAREATEQQNGDGGTTTGGTTTGGDGGGTH